MADHVLVWTVGSVVTVHQGSEETYASTRLAGVRVDSVYTAFVWIKELMVSHASRYKAMSATQGDTNPMLLCGFAFGVAFPYIIPLVDRKSVV